MLYNQKRYYADKVRGSFAVKRFYRIYNQRRDLEVSKQWNQRGKVKAIFKGIGGREGEREHACKLFKIGAAYNVISADTGPFSTFIELEGYPGEHNSVMFDVNYAELEKL